MYDCCPGQFPFDHDPAEFIAGRGKSYPRNPLIAEAFYLAKDIERWGSGLRRIKEECNAAGVQVKFESIKTGFQVTFFRPGQSKAQTSSEKYISETTQKTNQKTNQKIVEQIKKNPQITRKELAQIINLTEAGIKYHLSNMQKNRSIRRVGPDKGGHWEVVSGG